MNKDAIEIVLNELLLEQKEVNRINTELVNHIQLLFEKIKENDNKVADVRQVITKSATEIKSAIAAKPDTIIHRKSFQLFPSLNIKEYYRVYGHLMKWLVVLFLGLKLLTYLREILVKNGLL